jgi:hypothetical protein
MESRHFMKVGDIVQNSGGTFGRVVEGWALYAVVDWTDGRREEIDQFDPRVEVVERAVEPS